MHIRHLPRHARGWTHPYGRSPFSPVLYADGGGGDGGGSGSGGSPGGDGGGQGTGQQGGQPTAQNNGNQGSGQGGSGDSTQDIKSLPDWAQQVITDARADAGKARTTAKANAAAEARKELAAELAKILDPDSADDADPAKLASKLTASQAEARATAVQLAVYRAAGAAGADAEALLDSRRFLDSLKDVDPADTTSVAGKIAEAVQANPKLKAGGTGPGRSGGDHSGGSGDQPDSLAKQIEEATAKRDFPTVIRLKRQAAAQT